VNFVSTRGGGAPVSLGSAIAAGLASDGGLYVPESLPRLSAADFGELSSLADVALPLLSPFFSGDPLASELGEICREAFDFDTPLRPLGDSGNFMLELFHGPTAAFKDVGARFLASCLPRVWTDATRPLTILVATSGDTGAAVASAFHRRPGLRVVILYPEGRVSPRQAHQLGCFGDNVQALAVRGSFDDCQALAKQALADVDLQSRVPLSSANSISLGRLLPQMAWYAQAALLQQRLGAGPLDFIVPTGNLGNAMAGALARAMGLPIGRIVLATNANDVLPEFFAGGDYSPRASVATLANAMDVGAPSNFERLRWLYPEAAHLRQAFQAVGVDDAGIREAIVRHHARGLGIVCPHTATALAALERLGTAPGQSWAVVATAHPAKFERIVEPLIGESVPVPPALAALLSRSSHAESMAASYSELRERLLLDA
jgi:threonine synthase